jgi:hypothetical protein
MDRPTGLPMVLILECRSHLDLGDLPNLLAAELGVMTVRLERAIRTLDEVARVHVNRWGDGSAHLHMWFLARPYGRLQLRGTFLSLWDDILPVIPEQQWRGNLALVAAWLAEFGGRANAEPPHLQWQSPGTISDSPTASSTDDFAVDDSAASSTDRSASSAGGFAVDDGAATSAGGFAVDDSAASSTGGIPVAPGSTSSAGGVTDDRRAASSIVDNAGAAGESTVGPRRPADLADVEGSKADSRSVGAAFADTANGDAAGESARSQALQASRTAAESATGDGGREGTDVRLGGANASAGSDSAQAPRDGNDAPGGEAGNVRTGDGAGGAEPAGDHQTGSKTANGDAPRPDVIGDGDVRGRFPAGPRSSR